VYLERRESRKGQLELDCPIYRSVFILDQILNCIYFGTEELVQRTRPRGSAQGQAVSVAIAAAAYTAGPACRAVQCDELRPPHLRPCLFPWLKFSILSYQRESYYIKILNKIYL